MDVSCRIIQHVIYPTAAYSEGSAPTNLPSRGGENAAANTIGWQDSRLHPTNRIDSLDLLDKPLWRMDGSTGLGKQYFVVPLFIPGISPMRLDVFIYDNAMYPQDLREQLDLDVAFHTKEAPRLRRLGISKHILRILQFHTQDGGELAPDVVRELYARGPFGSRIMIENLSADVRACKVRVYGNHALEGDLLSYQELRGIWRRGDGDEQSMTPPRVSIQDLELVQQLYDSISLVRFKTHNGKEPPTAESSFFVLKSVTSEVKYLYHELHALLFLIPPGANVIGRPTHIVTKKCLFGAKNAVVGFVLPFHPTGSLRDVLPVRRIHGTLSSRDQLRWARQIGEALQSVQGKGVFYPDLRLDNVILSNAEDAILVDFEQRGVWCDFSAPEVNFFEYVRLLACDDADGDFTIPDDMRERYRQVLAGCRPDWSWDWLERIRSETKYSKPDKSYNIAWLCLTEREQEAATVYMLGRVLWCIFEGVSAPHRGAFWQSYRWEPDVEFPNFRRTPVAVRGLLQRCFRFGDVPVEEPCRFVRLGSRMYMKKKSADGSDDEYLLSAENLEEDARVFWRRRLEETNDWIRDRRTRLAAGDADETFGRPSLAMIVKELAALEAQLAPGDD